MPRKDGTGPKGNGAKSGKGLGNCAETSKDSTESDVGNGQKSKKGNGRKATSAKTKTANKK